jgi:AraC-like DNA-binding protein
MGTVDLELLDQLFDGLTEVPFFVKDSGLRYVAANLAMARLCGVRRPALMFGRRAADFFPPELSRRYESFDRQVLATGHTISNRFDLSVGAGAEPAWLLFTRAPIRAKQGEILGVAASARRFRSAGRTQPIYRRVARAARYIEMAFAEPVKLPELAATAGVSVSQLERDFASLLGATPHAVHNKARINRALQLLETRRSISAIAHECGYTDHSAFSRRFREAMGVSPRAYRELLRARTAEG